MSKWNKEELENMLEDVVNELDLSEIAVEKHGQEGTAPSELVKLVLEQKDLRIRALEANFIDANKSNCTIDSVSNSALPTLKQFAVNTFKAIGKQTERLNSGNASHQGMTIRGSANRAAEFIEKHYC